MELPSQAVSHAKTSLGRVISPIFLLHLQIFHVEQQNSQNILHKTLLTEGSRRLSLSAWCPTMPVCALLCLLQVFTYICCAAAGITLNIWFGSEILIKHHVGSLPTYQQKAIHQNQVCSTFR